MDYVFQFGAVFQHADQLFAGVLMTIKISIVVTILGFLFGVVFAQARIAGPPWLRAVVVVYVEFVRNTPFLVQLLAFAFAVPQLLASLGLILRFRPELTAIAALTANLSAYIAEIVRAGLVSIPVSQIEAAQGLALRPFSIFTRIALPQALASVYPALAGQLVLQMLGSSIVSTIAVQELTAAAGRVQAETFRSFEVYVLVALIYFALAYVFRLGLMTAAHFLLPWRSDVRKNLSGGRR
jgi:polar amino acid transport system permease protein